MRVTAISSAGGVVGLIIMLICNTLPHDTKKEPSEFNVLILSELNVRRTNTKTINISFIKQYREYIKEF